MGDNKADIKSIDVCISVLQGDLHQPGTPAIVLKLAASWQKLKPFLCDTDTDSRNLQLSLQEETCKQVSEETSAGSNEEETGSPLDNDNNDRTEAQEATMCATLQNPQATMVTSKSDSNGHGLALEPLEIQSPGLLLNDYHLEVWNLPPLPSFSLSLSPPTLFDS